MDNEQIFIASFDNNKAHTQLIFEELIKSALVYAYKDKGLSVVPIDGEILTDSIFNLNNHDEVQMIGANMTLNGQKFKEVFITTIVLRAFEQQRPKNMMVLTIPQQEESRDTILYIGDPGDVARGEDGKLHFARKEIEVHYFQIKEYIDWDVLRSDKILVPKLLTELGDIEKMKQYDETIVIYVRAFGKIKNEEMKKILAELKDKKIFIITALTEPFEVEGKKIPLKGMKYNFMLIDVWKDTMHHLFFDRPTAFKDNPLDLFLRPEI